MKSLLLILLLATGAMADGHFLGSVRFPLPGGHFATVRKIVSGKFVAVEMRDEANQIVWFGPILGESDRPFTVDGKASAIALKDMDGDGVPEVLTAAFLGPRSTALYTFRFVSLKEGFVPIGYRVNPKELRAALVSDAQSESGGDIVVTKDGAVQILGLAYQLDHEPQIQRYTYRCRGGVFELVKREPLPAGH